MRYTEKLHAYRLSLMLKKYGDDLCGCCPASIGFSIENSFMDADGIVCRICQKFVGSEDLRGCTCLALGVEEAFKRTKIKLCEGGYKC